MRMLKRLTGFISMLAMAICACFAWAGALAYEGLDRLGFANDVKAEIERESIASQKVTESRMPDSIGSGSGDNSARSFVAMLRDLDGRNCLASSYS